MNSLHRKLKHYVIRAPKDESAFLYFQLEANEGLAFYSTLPFLSGDLYRDIEITTDISLATELAHLLDSLTQVLHLEILVNEEIDDDPSKMRI